ncbi:protein of unknown function [Kyrpidia spormannii]|uniref:Uncharacterized protein n=2 Tax=Kyrpidia spormannii TaxID=2055160 RepID=A0ACA8ZC64_9BACL|nr:protein of unknown function [Kyrpidia spormannii]CAB3395687.1 protein of unknown function [Kyrpidia spormannii]
MRHPPPVVLTRTSKYLHVIYHCKQNFDGLDVRLMISNKKFALLTEETAGA